MGDKKRKRVKAASGYNDFSSAFDWNENAELLYSDIEEENTTTSPGEHKLNESYTYLLILWSCNRS
jgi:hypothetical protein